MNQNDLHLFPILVRHFNDFITEDERQQLIRKLSKTSHKSHTAIMGDAVSTHYDHNITAQVGNSLMKRLNEVANQYACDFGMCKVKILNIWSNIQNKGSQLKVHTHPNSEVSGALYVNVDENASPINFYNPNPYIQYQHYVNRNMYNFNHVWVKPKNGDLVLFPGWLRHGGPVNDMDNRLVISFNSILTTLR